MFLHLGNGMSVRTKDVIAIHDYTIFAKGAGNVDVLTMLVIYMNRLQDGSKIPCLWISAMMRKPRSPSSSQTGKLTCRRFRPGH